MADNNIDIQRLQEALDAFTGALTGTTSSMTQPEREFKKLADAQAKYEAALKKATEDQYQAVVKSLKEQLILLKQLWKELDHFQFLTLRLIFQ